MIWLVRVSIGLVCAGLVAWMAAALYFFPADIGPGWLRAGLAALPLLGTIVGLALVRPLRRVVVSIGVAFAVVLGAWLGVPPSHQRDWQPDVALLPFAEIDDDRVTVHNVRNADYRSETDFTVRYEDRELDLSKIRSLDIFFIHWGSPLIAHTIMSWGFEGDDYLAISIETRKEKGESYSPVRGFFRQYELFYVVADERDVVRLRSNFRGEDVYVYRLDAPPEGARALLLGYFEAINRLHEEPYWYNALTHNCTTTIQHLAAPFERRSWWSWQLFVNGYLAEYGYDIGAFDQSLPFAELKARSLVNERAKAAGPNPRFSLLIRQGIPRMTEASGG